MTTDSWNVHHRRVRTTLKACYESCKSRFPTMTTTESVSVPPAAAIVGAVTAAAVTNASVNATTAPTGGLPESTPTMATAEPTQTSTPANAGTAIADVLTTPATGGAAAASATAATALTGALPESTPTTEVDDPTPAAACVPATTAGPSQNPGDISSLSEEDARSASSPDISLPTHGSEAKDDKFEEGGDKDKPPTSPPRRP